MSPEEFEKWFLEPTDGWSLFGRVLVIFAWALIATAVVWALVGCSMRNEEIIAQVKLCQDNGMAAMEIQNQVTMQVVDVVCVPHKEH